MGMINDILTSVYDLGAAIGDNFGLTKGSRDQKASNHNRFKGQRFQNTGDKKKNSSQEWSYSGVKNKNSHNQEKSGWQALKEYHQQKTKEARKSKVIKMMYDQDVKRDRETERSLNEHQYQDKLGQVVTNLEATPEEIQKKREQAAKERAKLRAKRVKEGYPDGLENKATREVRFEGMPFRTADDLSQKITIIKKQLGLNYAKYTPERAQFVQGYHGQEEQMFGNHETICACFRIFIEESTELQTFNTNAIVNDTIFKINGPRKFRMI